MYGRHFVAANRFAPLQITTIYKNPSSTMSMLLAVFIDQVEFEFLKSSIRAVMGVNNIAMEFNTRLVISPTRQTKARRSDLTVMINSDKSYFETSG